MRPRRVRRGKSSSVAVPLAPSVSFNEAPASSPGKGLVARDVVVPEHERASMRPRRVRRGKRSGTTINLAVFQSASMRPRRVRRGKGNASPTPSTTTTRFNEAPASSPGKVELVQRHDTGTHIASMRPRRVRRGKPSGDHAPPRGSRASMRPRRVRRGKPFSTGKLDQVRAELQ